MGPRTIISVVILSLAMLASAQPRPATTNEPLDNEKRMIQAERNGDLKVFEDLMAAEAVTVGPDGERRNKTELIAIMRTLPPQNVTASEFVVMNAGANVEIVSYMVDSLLPDGGRRRHTASSVWVRRDGNWKMLFHQGTLAIPRDSL